MLGWIERLERRGLHELGPLLVQQAPDVLTSLQVGEHRRQELGRLTVGDQATTRADDHRRVLDADRARLLAGAARRALPEHAGVVDIHELLVALPGKQRGFVLQDQLLGIQQLSRGVGRAVVLATPALNAGQRVKHGFLREVLDGLEADLLLLEIEVGYGLQYWRLQKDGDRRQQQVQMLRVRNQSEEQEDHKHVSPPVHAFRRGALRQPKRQEEGHHQREDEEPNQDGFLRDSRAERRRPPDSATDEQVQHSGDHHQRKWHERQAINAGRRRVRDINEAEAAQGFHRRKATKRAEAPEHEQVSNADDGTLTDDASLEDDLGEEPVEPAAKVIEAETLGRGFQEPGANGHLHREPSDEPDQDQPKRPNLHRHRPKS